MLSLMLNQCNWFPDHCKSDISELTLFHVHLEDRKSVSHWFLSNALCITKSFTKFLIYLHSVYPLVRSKKFWRISDTTWIAHTWIQDKLCRFCFLSDSLEHKKMHFTVSTADFPSSFVALYIKKIRKALRDFQSEILYFFYVWFHASFWFGFYTHLIWYESYFIYTIIKFHSDYNLIVVVCYFFCFSYFSDLSDKFLYLYGLTFFALIWCCGGLFACSNGLSFFGCHKPHFGENVRLYPTFSSQCNLSCLASGYLTDLCQNSY